MGLLSMYSKTFMLSFLLKPHHYDETASDGFVYMERVVSIVSAVNTWSHQ